MRALLAGLLVFLAPSFGWAETNTLPVANAGADQSIFLGEVALLNGSATPGDSGQPILAWYWTLDSAPAGSGALFDDPRAQSTFFVPDMLGTYVITLVVYDGESYSLPSSLTLTVAVNLPPTAVASADVLSGPAPLTVQFDASGSSDPEGQPLGYAWIFGDGSSSVYAVAPVHVYEYPGFYGVSLSVFDSLGLSDTDSVVIQVLPASNAPPTVSPVATPNTGEAPLTVAFAANANDSDGDPLTYSWDFGDPSSAENTSTLANPSHVYEQEGAYVATLTVSDGQAEVSDSVDVVVSAAPEVSVSMVQVLAASEKGNRQGQVSLWADVAFGTLASEDTISVVFDGVELFSAPLSAFKAQNNSDIFVVVDRDLLVRIDLAAQQIMVQRRRVSLFGADLSNGVTVKVLWDTHTGIDQVNLTAARPGGIWTYTRDPATP